MDVRRTRFAAALALFGAWVAALVVLAVLSSRRPVARPRPAAPVAAEAPAP